MKGQIPRTFIDHLLASTDIVDVINSKVKLKKAGRDYQACCPFHNEKSPSFTVSQTKQFYHCFGCGAHGNVISFLMDYDKLEFVEAIEELANLQGIDIPYEKNTIRSDNHISVQSRKNLYEVMDEIVLFYQTQLTASITAQSYLQKRGLSENTINKFEIGFAANVSNSLLKQFASNSEQEKRLFELGMLSSSEHSSAYDKFRNRIMFPIRDKRGRVVGFGGRVLGDDKPKYLNSPETVIFHKGNELYGLYQAIQNNKNLDYLVVVEGYMDVVALAEFDINYAVASLGTATTSEQIQQAFRLTDQIICCYDGDRAGRDAAWRALENALVHMADGKQIKFVFLPDNEDPDSFVRKHGKEAFEQLLINAKPFSEFLFDKLVEQVDLSTTEGKSKLAELAIPLVKKIPGKTLKLLLRDMLGKKLGVMNLNQLEELVAMPDKISHTNNQKSKLRPTPMRLLIALLLQQPNLVKFVPDLHLLKNITEPGVDLFIELVQVCQANVGLTTGQLLEHWRTKENFKALEILVTWNHLIQEDNQAQTFCETLDFLYNKLIDTRIEILIAKDRTESLTLVEKQELVELLAVKK